MASVDPDGRDREEHRRHNGFGVPSEDICVFKSLGNELPMKMDPTKRWIWANDLKLRLGQRHWVRLKKLCKFHVSIHQHLRSYDEVRVLGRSHNRTKSREYVSTWRSHVTTARGNDSWNKPRGIIAISHNTWKGPAALELHRDLEERVVWKSWVYHCMGQFGTAIRWGGLGSLGLFAHKAGLLAFCMENVLVI